MKISCIIPVYNSEKYIGKCVKSIIANPDSELEVILVDDGSKDLSGKLCDTMAEKDSRIRVVHQENKGICGARNTGIDLATGEWICFVDNDDLIDPHAFDFLFSTLDETCDIIYYGFDEFRKETSIVPEDPKGEHPVMVLGKDEIKKLQWDCLCRYKDNKSVMTARLLTTPWGKLYRRKFLTDHGLRFVDGMKREEDVSFNLMCLAECRKAKYIDYRMYHYRLFIGSESHSYKKQIVDDAKQALAIYRDILKTRYPGRKDMMELYHFRVLWEVLYCVVLDSGHVQNPKKYKERKADFLQLFEDRDFRQAIEKCDIKRLGTSHRILATAIRKKSYLGVVCLTRAENILNTIKK